MSTLDLMEDGFPHGTREGYQKGCHSKGACMGPLDGLMTCVEANMRYASDFTYRKRVDAGDSALKIAMADREAAAKPKPAAPAKSNAPGAVGVAASVEPVREQQVEEVLEVEVEQLDDDVAVSPPPSSPSGERVSVYDEHEARMRELHAAGLSDAAIAREIGKPQPGTSRYLRKLGLEGNGRKLGVNAPPRDPESVETVDAVQERAAEVRSEAILDELAHERAEVMRLGVELESKQSELDRALADVAIEQAARETLNARVGDLTAQRIQADELRLDAEKVAAGLREELVQLEMQLDVVRTTPKPDPAGAELATVPSAPVATVHEAAEGPRVAGMGLDIVPGRDGAVSVRLHGGEPLQLSLQFDGGALRDVGVKIGA